MWKSRPWEAEIYKRTLISFVTSFSTLSTQRSHPCSTKPAPRNNRRGCRPASPKKKRKKPPPPDKSGRLISASHAPEAPGSGKIWGAHRSRIDCRKFAGVATPDPRHKYLVSILRGCDDGWKIATLFQNPTYGVTDWACPIVKKHWWFHTKRPKILLLTWALWTLTTRLLGSQQSPSRGEVIMSAARQH
jgi:hypothetical protein